MTATATLPQDLAGRRWSSLLRMAAVLAVVIVLAAGSFAFGRTSADTTIERSVVVPAAPADSCGPTVHTPPC